ncbi:MAG: hypothetical protein ACRDDX_09300 [Cellulosilyticaceae bacterium]
MATTRWHDNINISFDDVMKEFLIAPEDDTDSSKTMHVEWTTRKAFETNRTIQLNGMSIIYNYIEYGYNEISPGAQPLEDRKVLKEGSVIAYFNGSSIGYIINKNSEGLKILRRLLKFTGKGEITRNAFDITSDFFVWMISRVYTENNILDAARETVGDLIIESIDGFKGDTEDLKNRISASGDSVMNILSTLSFLLESRKLNQISFTISTKSHENINLILSTKGTVSFDENAYIGIYENEGKRTKLSSTYLVVYLELLPLLIQAYRFDVEEGVWDVEAFLHQIGKDVSEKLSTLIPRLKERNYIENPGQE